MEIYDCHMHSVNSPDGVSTIDEICDIAIARNLKAIAITDHNLHAPKWTPYENIKTSVEEAKRKQEELKNKLLVLSGVELEDYLLGDDYSPYYKMDLDIILGSVHSTPVIKKYFPDAPFGNDLMEMGKKADFDSLRRFSEYYYIELLNIAENADVDVITHLTFPLRYINGFNKRGLDISEFYPIIDAILNGVIKTGKALEINTSGLAIGWGELMPNEDIIKKYFDMGGRIVTLGSDAHKKENVGTYIKEATELLKNIGFTHGSYFIKRKRFEYKF